MSAWAGRLGWWALLAGAVGCAPVVISLPGRDTATEPSGLDDTAAPETPVRADPTVVEETVPAVPAAVGDEAVPDYGDPEERIYSDLYIHEFEIGLSDDALASLLDEPTTWVEASFTWEGRTWSPVGVRLKGEGSFLPITSKPSMKIKFDRYDDGLSLHGLDELTLNNMSSDAAMMHERVGYRVYREAGVPAARCNHAWVTINGDDYGLYANLETVDRALIRRWFSDADGRLFEVWDVDFKAEYIDAFELEYGDDDRTRLWGVADALEDDVPGAIDAAAASLDLEQFARYWAVGAVIGQFDAYPYSSPGDDAHVYDDPESGVLHFLPHGVDETFGSSSHDVTAVNGVIARRCQSDAACTALFAAEVLEVLDVVEAFDWEGTLDEVAAQIAEAAEEDPRKPYTTAAVWDEQDAMRVFVADRRAELQRQLEAR